jgi:prepilin-type N-terminal cleavage/methylation domain-containing protein
VQRSRPDSGFTFLEILAAIALIAIASGVLLTSLGRSFGIQLRHSARAVAAELEYVAQRAIARGIAQRWLVDLDHQLFRVEEQAGATGTAVAAALPPTSEQLDLQPPLAPRGFEPLDDRRGQWRELDDREIGIDEVVLRGESRTSGEVAITFAPDGAADPAEVWLHDPAGHDLLVRVVAFTGEIEVIEAERGKAKRQ